MENKYTKSRVLSSLNFEKSFLPLLSEKTKKIMEDYIKEGDEPMDHLDDSYDYIIKETEVNVDRDLTHGYYYTIYRIDSVLFYVDTDFGDTYFSLKLEDLLSDIELNLGISLIFDGENYVGQINQ